MRWEVKESGTTADPMEQYQRKVPLLVEAMQITEEVFTATHPSPLHITGVIYDPAERRVEIKDSSPHEWGRVGDWIVRDGAGGSLHIVGRGTFEASFEKVQAEEQTPKAQLNEGR